MPLSDLAGMIVSAETKSELLKPYIKLGITVTKASPSRNKEKM